MIVVDDESAAEVGTDGEDEVVGDDEIDAEAVRLRLRNGRRVIAIFRIEQ